MRAFTLMLALTCAGHAADVPAAWANVAHIPHDREISIALRGGTCLVGTVTEATGDAMKIRSGKDAVHVHYSQVLRISEGPAAQEQDTIYSGRSSWWDAFFVRPSWRERLIIETKTGREIVDGKPAATAEQVNIQGRSLPKSEVLKVIYLRYRPITATELKVHQAHLDFLAPRLWSRAKMVGLMDVPLYDAEQPEDNTELSCPLKK